MPTVQVEELRAQNATIRRLKGNILENIVHDNVNIEVEDVREIKELNLSLSDNKPYAILVDSGMMTSISAEARKLSASKEFQINTIAKALFVRSVGHRLVGNFYIKINKPHIKTKIFADREKAIDWLEEELGIYGQN